MTRPCRKRIIPLLLIGILASAAALPAEIRPEAGFIALDPIAFYFQNGSYFNRTALLTSPARMWFVCQPADTAPAAQPLFVFFNGGPGGATSCGLMAANTGRKAVVWDQATGGATVADNPTSWTRLGNLLYLDARTTGFSYSLMDQPGDTDRRLREFDAQNYNSFVDGADFVRTLLRFLAAHPEIRGNPVVLVPESYGGIRTIVMLHMLLHYEDYANGRMVYQNADLVREIRDHYDAVFPAYQRQTVPPAVIARQFGWEVMIQTVMSTPYQRDVGTAMLEAAGSPLYQVAAETGVPYIPYRNRPGANQNPTASQIQNYIYDYLDSVGRDPYHIAKPLGFLNGHRAASVELLTRIDSLNQMTGVDARLIPEMYASERDRAYKLKPTALEDLIFSSFVGPPPDAEPPSAGAALADVFGALQPWDGYFIDTNNDVTTAFSYNLATLQGYEIAHASTLLFGRMFLENVAWVETFATDAAWDAVVYSAALPEALALYTDILAGTRLDRTDSAGLVRPGRIILDYRPAVVPGYDGGQREIRFPRYLLSGHAVTMTEPAEILEDVASWLEAAGPRTVFKGGHR